MGWRHSRSLSNHKLCFYFEQWVRERSPNVQIDIELVGGCLDRAVKIRITSVAEVWLQTEQILLKVCVNKWKKKGKTFSRVWIQEIGRMKIIQQEEDFSTGYVIKTYLTKPDCFQNIYQKCEKIIGFDNSNHVNLPFYCPSVPLSPSLLAVLASSELAMSPGLSGVSTEIAYQSQSVIVIVTNKKQSVIIC